MSRRWSIDEILVRLPIINVKFKERKAYEENIE